jgi:chorismate mutase
MNSVSALDASAPKIENDLPGCIRIMMNVSKEINEVKHVYLKEAASLRKDR